MTESIGKALAIAIKEPGPSGQERLGGHIFMNPRRREIFSRLTMTPFMGATALASALGLSGRTVKWHLDVLTKAGYVAAHPLDGRQAFFPEGLVGREHAELFHSVNHPRQGRLYRKVMGAPGLFQSELAAEAGESRQSAARTLSELADRGLLTAVADGARMRYYPTRLLPDKAEEFFKRSKDFSEYILRRLESEGGAPPKVVKRGLDTILVEMGHAARRFTMAIAVNPFMTCNVC